VRVHEGSSPEQIANFVGEVSGISVMTVSGLDPDERHYFRVKGGRGGGIIAAERGDVPLVFADSGGAARTGWAAAVVQMALGVTDQAVMDDYLLTNQFRESLNRAQLDGLLASGRLAKAVYLERQLFERAEYLRAALDEMRRIYGSFENYVHQALGISDEQLEQIRENLLEG
jgi:protein-tyrosine phosphatase